jgi:hypothetical protein
MVRGAAISHNLMHGYASISFQITRHVVAHGSKTLSDPAALTDICADHMNEGAACGRCDGRHCLAMSNPRLVVGGADSRGLAVGFEDGDDVVLGAVTRHGLIA